MAPKKDTKQASVSAQKKDHSSATATPTSTANVKKSTNSSASTSGKDTTKIMTKDRKEKIQTKALKAKQRVVR